MRFSTLTLVATLSTLTPVQATLTNSTDCADIHFMLARGTTESYPGTPYSLAELVAANTSLSSNYENIIYPAVDETSSDSYFAGRVAVGKQVTAYVDSCPDSKIIVLSYSQGAMIVGDALAGGGGNVTLGNATEPGISERVGRSIIANVYFGNPRHVPGEPYDFGTTGAGKVTGKYPRLPYQIANLDVYRDVSADWCNVGDGVCSPSEGADSLSLHMAYAKDYDDVAAGWVLEKINGF
ncbi:alpha/beta-hydrolase [Aspergillus stella-maris]|uniref:alpha/beta-hydrolase n=1 Tax=Aspergillus stella-maris TaxID=1810926 RepID=UPI003CCDD483